MRRVSYTCTMAGRPTKHQSLATTPRDAHQMHHLQGHVESAVPVAKRNLNIVTQASGKFPIFSGFVKWCKLRPANTKILCFNRETDLCVSGQCYGHQAAHPRAHTYTQMGKFKHKKTENTMLHLRVRTVIGKKCSSIAPHNGTLPEVFWH